MRNQSMDDLAHLLENGQYSFEDKIQLFRVTSIPLSCKKHNLPSFSFQHATSRPPGDSSNLKKDGMSFDEYIDSIKELARLSGPGPNSKRLQSFIRFLTFLWAGKEEYNPETEADERSLMRVPGLFVNLQHALDQAQSRDDDEVVLKAVYESPEEALAALLKQLEIRRVAVRTAEMMVHHSKENVNSANRFEGENRRDIPNSCNQALVAALNTLAQEENSMINFFKDYFFEIFQLLIIISDMWAYQHMDELKNGGTIDAGHLVMTDLPFAPADNYHLREIVARAFLDEQKLSELEDQQEIHYPRVVSKNRACNVKEEHIDSQETVEEDADSIEFQDLDDCWGDDLPDWLSARAGPGVSRTTCFNLSDGDECKMVLPEHPLNDHGFSDSPIGDDPLPSSPTVPTCFSPGLERRYSLADRVNSVGDDDVREIGVIQNDSDAENEGKNEQGSQPHLGKHSNIGEDEFVFDLDL